MVEVEGLVADVEGGGGALDFWQDLTDGGFPLKAHLFVGGC